MGWRCWKGPSPTKSDTVESTNTNNTFNLSISESWYEFKKRYANVMQNCSPNSSSSNGLNQLDSKTASQDMANITDDGNGLFQFKLENLVVRHLVKDPKHGRKGVSTKLEDKEVHHVFKDG